MVVSDAEKLEIGCLISLIFYTYCVARRYFPKMKRAWDARSTVLSEVLQNLKRWWAPVSESSLLDEYVSKEVERQLLQGIQKVVTSSAHFLAPVVCMIMLKIRNGAPLRMSEMQCWLLIVACSIFIFCSTVSTTVNRRTVHLWYPALSIGLTAFVLSSTAPLNAEMVWNQNNVVLPLRVMLAITYSRFPVVVVTNTLHTFVTLYFMAMRIDSADEMSRFNGTTIFDVLTLFGILYFSRTTILSLRREVLSTARATCLQGEGTAMTHLLDVMCDVVVELDSEKRIAEKSKRLAAMVAINPKTELVGTQLQEWMPIEEERKKVDDLLLAMSKDTKPAEPRLAHVTWRDSYGMHFRVELFIVHFRALDRSSRCYVGIQESRDVPIGELKRARHATTSNDNTSSSDDSSLGAPIEPLLHPHFQRTKQDKEVLSLMMAIVTWNFIVPPRKCCAYHAAWDEVQRIVEPLMEGPCKFDFNPDFSAQCSSCGILDDWDSVRDSLQCSYCNSQGTMTRGARFSSL